MQPRPHICFDGGISVAQTGLGRCSQGPLHSVQAARSANTPDGRRRDPTMGSSAAVLALQDIDACRPEVSKKCLRGNGAPCSPTHRERANRHAPSERSAPTACLPVASLHTLAHSTAIHAPKFRMPGGRPRSSGAYLQHPRCAAGRPKQCSAEPQPSIQEHPNAPAR